MVVGPISTISFTGPMMIITLSICSHGWKGDGRWGKGPDRN